MVKIKTPEDIKEMRKLGKRSAKIMKGMMKTAKEGATTKEVEEKANYLMKELNVKPAFLGYRGFPASICISVNEELIHGIPSEEKLLSPGDLVSIDFGLTDGQFYSDMTRSFCIGKPSKLTSSLLKTGREALSRAIKTVKPSACIGDIGWAIQKFVEAEGFFTVKKFVGHGIGSELHEEPEVPNFGKPGEGMELKEGMVIAIEPMVTVDSPEVKVLDDGWTVVSKDKRPCVHFEHTVAITRRGAVVLTN